MRMIFNPAEENEYEAVRGLLVHRFEQWAWENGIDAEPFVVEAALDYRHLGTPDGRLGLRDQRHIEDFLLDWVPRTVTVLPGKRALVAVMHKLTIAIWHVLHDKSTYRELGAAHFTRRNPERTLRRMRKEANSLGLTVRFEPITARLAQPNVIFVSVPTGGPAPSGMNLCSVKPS
jgi:hypothetical protein